jgi:hypothetical protein
MRGVRRVQGGAGSVQAQDRRIRWEYRARSRRNNRYRRGAASALRHRRRGRSERGESGASRLAGEFDG